MSAEENEPTAPRFSKKDSVELDSREPPHKRAADDTCKVSCEDLIRFELEGKLGALARYDSILWKIRAGYILALYGTLTVLGGTSGLFAAANTTGRSTLLIAAFLLIGGFSACGFWLDYLFIKAKFRVVVAANALYKVALDSAIRNPDVNKQYESLSELLRISGEDSKNDKTNVVQNEDFQHTWHSVIWLYFISPFLGLVILVVFILWSQ